MEIGRIMRHLRIHDLPFLYRMVGQGVSFDTYLGLTVGHDWLSQAVLTGTGRIQPYVVRGQEDSGYAVLHYPSEEPYAWLAFVAPALKHGGDEGLWLTLVDGVTERAGRHGCVSLIAEVDECSEEFELLRHAGFGTYERESIWRRSAGPVEGERGAVRVARNHEAPAIQALYRSLVPGLIKQVAPPPTVAHTCYVMEGAQHALTGIFAVYRGPRASMIECYLRPEAYEEAPAALRSVLSNLQAEDRAVYCRAKQHTFNSESLLEGAGFEYQFNQAVMVRHTATRVRAALSSKSAIPEGGSLPLVVPVIGYED